MTADNASMIDECPSMRLLHSTVVLVVSSAALVIAGCGRYAPPPAQAARQIADAASGPHKLSTSRLPNAWQIHARVISGGMPEGDAAFMELAALGVKTVISVDGARPDVEAARKRGLRYVHLPHGYDGVPETRMKELAKAVRDLPGPVYIHCHHGKHRSPAAAAVACVGAGLIAPSSAEPILIAAGTSEAYRGLYQSARQARQFETRLLDELQAEFPEVAKLPPLAEAMVSLEQTHEELKAMEAAGWQSIDKHPDIDPAHEALLLREHFSELLRSEVVKAEPARFQALLRESESAAQALEDALKEGKLDSAKALLTRVTANCKTCHTAFRDVPLSKAGSARVVVCTSAGKWTRRASNPTCSKW